MSTQNTDPKTPTTKTPRTRGRALLPPPATEALIAAQELADNPKALELSMKLANVEGEREYWKRLANSRLETLQGRNQEIGQLKASLRDETTRLEAKQVEVRELLDNRQAVEIKIAELEAENSALLTSNTALRDRVELESRDAILWRKVAKDALFDLSSGAADTTSNDPEVIAQSLKDATRIATETGAQVELLCRLLSISPDPTSDWVEAATGAVKRLEESAAEGVRGPLLAELEGLRREVELYRTSTNNLGGMVKWQARGGVRATVSEDAYPGDALANDLPSGLLSGVLLSPKTIVWLAWIAAGLAFYAGWLIGGAK